MGIAAERQQQHAQNWLQNVAQGTNKLLPRVMQLLTNEILKVPKR